MLEGHTGLVQSFGEAHLHSFVCVKILEKYLHWTRGTKQTEAKIGEAY